ncbi:MAG: DNA polymerase III subunit alpha [Acidaminococcaceae bacterium]
MMNENFTHLHVHTQYSLLDGASKIEDLISYTKELGMSSIAITDHGVMYGAIEFYQEAKKQGIKPIIGCEVYITSGSRHDKSNAERENQYHLILLAENNEGYQNLMKVVSIGHLEGFYYKPRIDKEVLQRYSKGLICLSACIAGEIPAHIIRGELESAEASLQEYLAIFGRDNFFLEIQNHDIPEENIANRELKRLAAKYKVGLVATNDLHYVRRSDAAAQDILLCIQTNARFTDEKRMKFPNDNFYLKSSKEMQERFPDCAEALANTNKIAERCNVELEFGHLLLPEFPLPAGLTEMEYLRQLCVEGMPQRYPELTGAEQQRLDYELGVIAKMGYPGYFLIVWDFIKHCRENDIPVGPGRGSAAGSIVAYLLGITNIDPLKYDLLFERFLNPERVSMPDIDVDICYIKREKVVEYLTSKYGAGHVAQIITFGTLAAKAAVKDVGRALEIPLTTVNQVNKLIPNELGITLAKALKTKDLKNLYDSDEQVAQMLDFAQKVEGSPRHTSTHAAGVVITPGDLTDYVPLQRTADDEHNYVCTQYDKDKAEGLGLLKMDLLGLRTLTVIDDALHMIEVNKGVKINLERIDLADAKTCAMLCRGETAGIFQMESAGMTQLMRDLAPESFEDLIPLVALYRPGPLGTGMVEDFIAGRHGTKTAKLLHPLLEPVLKPTFGVILYQEQVMQITSVLAGFSLGEADILRRAMGKKKAKELDSMKEKFVQGAGKYHELAPQLAEEIFALLQHFAGYGFNKSHSAAYALVAYQTAYLKAHYPVELMAATLNSFISAGDKVSWYINVCREMGIQVLPPDINISGSGFSVDGQVIRFGLAGIKNVGEAAIKSVLDARQDKGPFKSLIDFCQRVDTRATNKRVVENLIKCGAMDSFGAKRSQLLAVMDRALEIAASQQKDLSSGQIGLFGEEEFKELNELVLPDIAEIKKDELLLLEKDIIGFYVTGHPLDKYRSTLKTLTEIRNLGSYRDGQYVTVGGIISANKIRVTKTGSTMAVFTLEDFGGKVEIVAFPKVYTESNRFLHLESMVTVEGRIQLEEEEPRLMAMQIKALAEPAKDVKIMIAKELENAATQQELRRIFITYKGKSTVYLHLLGSKKIIKTESSFWVDADNPKLLEELRKLLGPNAVHI